MSEIRNKILQVGTSQEGNPTTGSDRVQAPVAGAGSMDFGGSQSHRDELRQLFKPPLLMVDNRPLSRSDSNVSLNSLGSCKSVFSSMSATDMDSWRRDRDACKGLRTQETELLDKMLAEVAKMIGACERQKNVNQTVKDGLKNLNSWINDAKNKHEEAARADTRLYETFDYIEGTHRYRKEHRKVYYADTIRRVALAVRKGEKRPLSSPEEEKRKVRKAEPEVVKTKVPAKRKKKRKKGLSQPEEPATPGQQKASTMLIRVAEGQSYASVLGKLRKNVDPEACNTTVLGARPTQKGDLLLRLGGDSNREAFTAKVTEVVGSMATVRVPDDQKVTLEIRDLDSLTEEEEVVSALERVLEAPRTNRMVKLLPANRRGIKLAVVTVARREAAILERLGHVKVGFMSCCVRRRVTVTRCHRCLDFGHKAVQCKGVDRSSACFKCGETGHTLANCKKDPRCFLCSAKDRQACDHVAGSGKCAAFREVLEAAKKGEALRRR